MVVSISHFPPFPDSRIVVSIRGDIRRFLPLASLSCQRQPLTTKRELLLVFNWLDNLSSDWLLSWFFSPYFFYWHVVVFSIHRWIMDT